MPELPEVETVRKQLEKALVGLRIKAITPLHPKTVSGNPRLAETKTIEKVGRFGKMLVIYLTGNTVIAIHFKMSGQLLYRKNLNNESGIMDKHTRAVFEFTNGNMMLFNDQRIFGWVRIMMTSELQTMKFLQKLGPEPWNINEDEFHNRLQKKYKSIKTVITDQDVVCGVGNIYANDGLWLAGIDPARSARSLRRDETDLLLKSLREVLDEGIKFGGSTGQDKKYVHLNGNFGSYQKYFKVYDRVGMLCLRQDNGKIEKITLGGRGTYYCPVCQK